ncbi:hypothetical protein [Puerhibacterium puerhi]|uniref:hypothetical protein n=1 Tax=Puerhibacterium puerhi TaxID=2692623 RepID=UPI001358F92A|nr:hypothetical protein [Puerhibacterium puerhi]
MAADPSIMARHAHAPLRAEAPRRPDGPQRAPAPRERTRGDDRTVDPADRRRRANAALLELVVEQAARRR